MMHGLRGRREVGVDDERRGGREGRSGMNGGI